ncbi:MAG: hypothetical protein ABIR56_15085 [Polaromonas sp.]
MVADSITKCTKKLMQGVSSRWHETPREGAKSQAFVGPVLELIDRLLDAFVADLEKVGALGKVLTLAKPLVFSLSPRSDE